MNDLVRVLVGVLICEIFSKKSSLNDRILASFMPFVVLLFKSDVLGEEKEALWSSLNKKFDDRSEWLMSIDEFNAKSKRHERKIFF